MRNLIKGISLTILPACSLYLAACNQNSTSQKNTTMADSTQTTASAFEKTIDGKQTHLFTLKNKNGVIATITNYG